MSDLETLIDIADSNRAKAFAQSVDPELVARSASRHGMVLTEQKDEAGGGETVTHLKTPNGTLEARNGIWTTRDEPKKTTPEYARIDVRNEDGIDFRVGVMADGSEFLLGKVGAQGGAAVKIKDAEQPNMAGEITRGVIRGAFEGAQKMGEGFNRALGLEPIVDAARKVFAEAGLPTDIPLPETTTPTGEVAGEVGKVVGEVAGAAIPAGMGIKAAGMAGQGVAVARTLIERMAQGAANLTAAQKGTIIGAAVDAFAFGEPQIAQSLRDLPPEWQGPVTDAVASALEATRLGKVEDDGKLLTEVENRIRAAAEGAVLGKTVDGAVAVGKSIATAWKAMGLGTIAAMTATDAEAGAMGDIGKAAKKMTAAGPKPFGEKLTKREGPYVTVRAATTEEEAKVLAQMDLPPVGFDINLSHVNGEVDLGKLIDATSVAFAKQTAEQTKGVVTHKETLATVRQKFADDLGVNVGDLVFPPHLAVGGDALTNWITGARTVLFKSGQAAMEAANKIRLGQATDADRLEFRRLLALHGAAQANFKGIQTDIARALSSFNIDVGPDMAGNAAMVKNLLTEAGGIETTDALARKFATIYEKSGPRAASRFAEKSFAAKTIDSFFEVYINGLLSATGTHVSNIVSTALFDYGILPIERAMAGAIGSARRAVGIGSEEQAYMGEALAMYRGAIGGIGDSLRLAGIALKTEMPNDPIGKIEAMRHKAISAETLGVSGPMGKGIDWLGSAVRMPGRFLMAEDEFFKATGFRMEQHAQAYRTYRRGIEDGLSKDQALEAAAKILADPDPAMKASLEDAARVMTFTNPLEGKAMQAMSALHQTPVGRLIIPFLRTPVNIMQAGFERSPAALLMPSFYRDIAAGGSRADAAMARVALGSSISAYVGNEVLDGRITGSGPSNKDAREIWLKNNQPYSVKIGDTWVSYQRMDPIAIPMALIANAIETQKVDVHNSKDEENLSVLIVGKVADVIKDKAFFAGLGELLNAMNDPKRYGADYMAKQVGNILQPVYAAALREVTREFDPLSREIKPDPNVPPLEREIMRITNSIRARTPGWSTDLPVKPDIFGDDKRVNLDDTVENLTGIPMKPVGEDRVVDELIRLGMPIAKPEPELQGVKLDPSIHAEYVKLAGKEIKIDGKPFRDTIEAIMDAGFYRSAPPGDQRDHIKRLYDAYKEQAKIELLKRHPELKADMIIEKIRKRME